MGRGSGLSDAEMDVLKVLWDHGPANVRLVNAELAARGRCWAYTTVATLLQRLAAKGFTASDSTAVPHVYRAVVSRDEFLQRRLRDAADELCDGETAPLLLALVRGGRFTAQEVQRFRRMLDEAAPKPADPAPRRPRKPKS